MYIWAGTSWSTPFVSALVSLILSVNNKLTPPQIYKIITKSADKIGSHTYDSNGWNQFMGYGRINAYQALKYTLEHYGGTVAQDLTIPAGETWSFDPGVTITFTNGAYLYSYGVIQANGTASQPITFTADSTGGGIYLDDSTSSGSVFNHITMQNGWLDFTNTSNIIVENSTISPSQYADAIDFTASSGTVTNNTITISNTSGYGIWIAEGPATVDCFDNTLTKTGSGVGTGKGIYYYWGTVGSFARNDIDGFNWGVASYWGASPDSYNNATQYEQRNNRIRNCTVGLYVDDGAYLEMGNSPSNDYMWNSIYNNTYNAKVGTQFPNTESGLEAEGNWWGTAPPPSNYQVGSSSWFTFTNYLSSDPWAGYSPASSGLVAEDRVTGSAKTAAAPGPMAGTESTSTTTKDSLWEGISLRIQGNKQKAEDFFRSYLSRHPGNQRAYLELYHCAGAATTPDLISYFKSLPDGSARMRDLYLSWLYLSQDKVATALSMDNKIIQHQPDTSLVDAAELNTFYIDLNFKRDEQKAEQLLSQLKNQSDNPSSEMLQDAEHALQIYGGTSKAGSSGEKNPAIQASPGAMQQPAHFALSQNYPNPFNPSTNIRYELPQNSKVHLTIWNVLGQRVATLINARQLKGDHQVTFDASRLSSGIYFYRLKAGKKVMVKKMLLLK